MSNEFLKIALNDIEAEEKSDSKYIVTMVPATDSPGLYKIIENGREVMLANKPVGDRIIRENKERMEQRRRNRETKKTAILAKMKELEGGTI